MATTYNVYFGLAGAMTLRSEGQATTTWDIPVGEIVYGEEYEWRIDSINEYGTTYGEVWSFTTLTFYPPSTNLASIKRLIVVADDKVFYET